MILIRRGGIGRHREGPRARRVRSEGRGNVAVSLARRRYRPASRRPRRVPGRGSGRPRPARRPPPLVLPDRTRKPRRPTRWAAATSAFGSSPTIANADRGSRSPRSAREPRDRLAEDDRRRLAERPRAPAGRVLEADHEGAGVEGDPARRQPPRDCGASRGARRRRGPAGTRRPCSGTTGRRPRHR